MSMQAVVVVEDSSLRAVLAVVGMLYRPSAWGCTYGAYQWQGGASTQHPAPSTQQRAPYVGGLVQV